MMQCSFLTGPLVARFGRARNNDAMRRTLPLTLCLLSAPAWGQAPATPVVPGAPEARQATPGGQTASKPEEEAAGFWQRSNLFGTLGGLRPALADRGITFGIQETSEVLGNVSGGTRRAQVYEGLTQLSLGLDTDKAFGLPGGTFNVSAYQIHGRGLSVNALNNNLHTVSSLEAGRGTLLFELWYEQVLLDKVLSIRVGQLAADQEFMISQYAGLFVNHTFGWSTHPSTDLPSSGPSYPLATPGVRVRLAASEEITLLAAAFNGDPAGPGRGVPQSRDASGTAFRLRDGVFAIAELQYARNQSEGAEGLPGTFKLGGWAHSGAFSDQRRTRLGDSLAAFGANVGETPAARLRRGNYGLYAMADQVVWRRAKDQAIGVFARVMGSPGDRNLVNVYVDAGVTLKGLLPARPADTAGLAVGYARISDTASKLDSDQAAIDGRTPVRRHETVLEATYQAQLAPWWQVQPYAQYVFNLNGGVLAPSGKRLGDAALFGVRTSLTF